MITSDTRNFSDFRANLGFIDPLRAHVQSPPNLPAVHGLTGWAANNRDFAKNFQSTTNMFDSPKDQAHWDDTPFDPFGFQSSNSNNQNSNSRNTDYSNLYSDWARIENRVSENARNQINGTSPSPELRSGLGYNSFSDSNQIQSRSGGAAGADEIAKVAQQTGQAGVNLYTAIRNNNVEQQYQRNVLRGGIHSELHANMIKSSENSRNGVANAAGNIGAIFGPIGAVVGTALGNAFSSRVDPNSEQFKTAWSNTGKINPQDSGIVSSNTTAGASGESQQQLS